MLAARGIRKGAIRRQPGRSVAVLGLGLFLALFLALGLAVAAGAQGAPGPSGGSGPAGGAAGAGMSGGVVDAMTGNSGPGGWMPGDWQPADGQPDDATADDASSGDAKPDDWQPDDWRPEVEGPGLDGRASPAAAAAAPGTPGAPVVVELFTSQGCSSCPPADDLLATLAMREDVIALALHVDYWDYIGWEDQFADPAFTERQKRYARRAGARTIYTPQMIVGGMEHIVGVRPDELALLLAQHLEAAAPVTVSLRRADGVVEVAARAAQTLRRPAEVQLVRYRPLEQVEIGRGENAGLVVDYANIVTDWQVIGRWDGAAPLAMTAPVAGDEATVVIVQEPGGGRILGAARLW